MLSAAFRHRSGHHAHSTFHCTSGHHGIFTRNTADELLRRSIVFLINAGTRRAEYDQFLFSSHIVLEHESERKCHAVEVSAVLEDILDGLADVIHLSAFRIERTEVPKIFH